MYSDKRDFVKTNTNLFDDTSGFYGHFSSSLVHTENENIK